MHANRHAHILDVNHAWQVQLVEAFGICPYARRCRLDGKLERQVLDGHGETLHQALVAAIVALGRRSDPPEIALLLCPDDETSSAAFERTVQHVAQAAESVLGAAPFHVVAFHPQLPFDPATPQGLVAFWRRTPHPTVQLVHAPTLARIKGDPPSHYVDPDDADAISALLGQPPILDLADRIALANWRTWNEKYPDVAAAIAPFSSAAAVPEAGHVA